MPTLNTITLPDGVTYDLTAVNREVVPIITEYSGSETTFNALEITENESQQTIYNINAPDGTALFTWTDDSTLDYPLAISEGTKITGKFSPRGGVYFPDTTALPKQTASNSYNVIVFDAFASGGRAKYASATSSNTASSIVSRDSNGDFTGRYINATYFNMSAGAVNPASYTSYVPFFSSDNYLRKSTLANFKSWFGASNFSTLNYLGYTASSTQKDFTVSTTATWFVITGAFTGDNINKLFTSPIPKNLLGTTAKEIWLGGGWGGANTSAARCLCNVTLVNSTTLRVKGTAANNGTTSTLSGTTFYVYQI